MSRCFPFTPHGYGARDEALINLIKLREEMEKAEKDRRKKKDRKREKREREREKRERKREKKERRKEEKERKLKEGASTDRGTDDQYCENEQFDKSEITEELDQPVTCCLSDSSQSSKRKRSSPQSTHHHGSPIKNRLPSRKHGEPEESKFQLWCSSGSVGATADSFTKTTLGSDLQSQCYRTTELKQVLEHSDSRNGKAKQNPVHGDGVITKNTLVSDHQLKSLKITEPKRVLGNSDSKHCKLLQNLVHGDAMVTYAVDDGSQKVESLYESLLQIPPLTYDGLDSIYEDWLFSSELKESGPVSKKKKCDSDVFQLSNSMWPRAQYWPEVEVYALPYTVAF